MNILISWMQLGIAAFIFNISAFADGLIVYNAGVPGNTTRGGLARFDADVRSRNPDICFIAFGMNDAVNSQNSVPLVEYRQNLEEMITRCRTGQIVPVLININPVNEAALYERHDPGFYSDRGGANAIITDYNGAAASIAQQTGTDLIDWHARVMGLSGDSTAPGSVLGTDGVHLTPVGISALADLVTDWCVANNISNSVVVAFGDSITHQGWIDEVAKRYKTKSGGMEYSSTIAPSSGHPDTDPPTRLVDGAWRSVTKDSVEYAGDPVIEFVLPSVRHADGIDVYCFSQSNFQLKDVQVEVKAGGEWVSVEKQWSSIPVQTSLGAEPGKLSFNVDREISRVRVKLFRQRGSVRVLISEVAVR